MKKLLLAVVVLIIFEGLAAASLLEVTTGGKQGEGIAGISGGPLKDKSLVQIIRTKDGSPKPPDKLRNPIPPDELINSTETGYNFPFNRDEGKFDFQVWANGGEKIYVRAWEDQLVYGDSELYTVSGVNGEIWNIGGEEGKPAFNVRSRVPENK